jgi:NAD(P)-dependent dehydrogenase (short-subunit alcohol dehydrogenase family)
MRKLEGKVAVITGSNSGIGLAAARKFAEHGAKDVISGRDPKTLEKAARKIGGDTLAIRADVAEAVLFLASPDSAYVVGGELNVDGGMGQR